MAQLRLPYGKNKVGSSTKNSKLIAVSHTALFGLVCDLEHCVALKSLKSVLIEIYCEWKYISASKTKFTKPNLKYLLSWRYWDNILTRLDK